MQVPNLNPLLISSLAIPMAH